MPGDAYAQAMRLPPTPRVLVLRDVRDRVLAAFPRGRVIVAVDGGGGTSGFADDLAEVFREIGKDTFRAAIRGFHRPRNARTRYGPETPEGYYRDSYDYVTLRRVLLDPFRLAGSAGFQTAVYDQGRDAAVESEWTTAGPDAVLVIDGEFLLRPELRGEWDASVRLADPPGRVSDSAQTVYADEVRPDEVADLLIDDHDPERPVIVGR